MRSLEDFRTNLLETVRANAAQGDYLHSAFVTEAADQLLEAEELSDWTPCLYRDRGYRRRELIVDGFSIDEVEVDSSVSLLIADFRNTASIESLTATQVSTLFGRALNFVRESFSGRLHEELEPSTPASDLATWLFENQGRVGTIRVFLVSDASTSTRLKELPEDKVGTARVELHIWDIVRFHRLDVHGGREPIVIDLREFVTGGLPAIRASLGSVEYESYLCVLPGNVLAQLYDRYGSRLLEGNVRAFLSTRGAVNKGLRNTILNEPTHFFAYNNGVTATATKAEVVEVDGLTRIIGLSDMQIVNGGQTTASLYHARLRDQAELSSVFVQLKLSVVSEDEAISLIPQISRYANSQNKVSDADFFANHPFHRRIEELSRRTWAPPRSGEVNQTKWFYERARGQYVSEQSRLSASSRRTFLIQHPKNQLVTKTDLAKYENSWEQLPHVVSLGAQKNFIRFAERITPAWDRADSEFNERWFRQMIAKAILFAAVEKLVSTQPWYQGGYRANIVTYCIAKLSHALHAQGRTLDFERIWRNQSLDPALEGDLQVIAKLAWEVITTPPTHLSNVTEWSKKEQCWINLRENEIQHLRGIDKFSLGLGEERVERKSARKDQLQDDAIAQAAYIVSKGPEYWHRVQNWGRSHQLLTDKELGVLATATRVRNFVPSDAQAALMIGAEQRMIEEGFS